LGSHWLDAGRRWSSRLAAIVVGLLWALPTAWGAGTPAGTAIPNTAVLTYTIAGAPGVVSAASAPVIVARVLSVTVTWQDSTPTPSSSPDTQRPLAFVVTNTGNAPDTFRLSRNNAIPGDQFDPTDSVPAAIWLESGAQAGWQSSGAAADIVYVAGGNDITLAADASRVVYLSSAIPAGQVTGAVGKASLTAVSTAVVPGATPGMQVGLVGGVPIVVGRGGGQASATGSYLVSSVAVGISKNVVAVRDPSGGTAVTSGSVLTYRLVLTAAGTGTVTGVTVTDPLPPALTYVPGSLTVDGASRTDAADGDDSSAAAGTVTATFPSITAPATRAIEFKATVN
jgi:uncharacterized repeat protein (TIGR01451 family)